MLKIISKKIWDEITRLLPEDINPSHVDVWFQDESRIGQKGTLTRVWAPKGQRPRVVRQQQYINGYIFGAVCPSKGFAEAIISPYCNSDAMYKHLQQISKATEADRIAVVLMDRAGWHTTEKNNDFHNVIPMFFPPSSPELNPMEQVWGWLKDHFLSNRTFEDYEDILESSCLAWNIFASNEDLISSICSRSWAQ